MNSKKVRIKHAAEILKRDPLRYPRTLMGELLDDLMTAATEANYDVQKNENGVVTVTRGHGDERRGVLIRVHDTALLGMAGSDAPTPYGIEALARRWKKIRVAFDKRKQAIVAMGKAASSEDPLAVAARWIQDNLI